MMISAFIKYVLLNEVPCGGVQKPYVSRLSIKRLNAIRCTLAYAVHGLSMNDRKLLMTNDVGDK
jgi:hypothetical protein